ncbi:MAG TPA: hypothetical protein VFL86_14405 [Burkholderiaceae bacterium]|nr:hypothetical protein [Burkholderiaceae bacterium]
MTAERGTPPFVEGSTYRETQFSTLLLNLGPSPDQTNLRAGAQDALVWVDGSVFASGRINQAFAHRSRCRASAMSAWE